MTRRVALSMLAGILAVVLQQPVLAQTAADVQQKAADTWQAFQAYTNAKKDDVVAHGKPLMRETDAKITQLEGKAAQASGDAKVGYEQEIKALKVKRDAVGKKLEAMGEASASSWDAIKQGFADAYQDLHQSYEKAVVQFK